MNHVIKKMKNKNKFYLLASVFFFLSVFFVSASTVKADECSECAESYGEAWCIQENFCSGPSQNTDSDICPGGFYKGRDGKCYPEENQNITTCGDGFYLGRDGQCYPEENQSITTCGDGYYAGRDGQCYPNENLTDQPKTDPSACSIDNDCLEKFGKGYKCDSSGTCMVDGFFDGTECRSDADCDRQYGAGFECSGVFISTCERKASSGITSGGGSNSPAPIATTTAATNVGGRSIPAGTQVNSDGSATNPSTGQQVAPAGSFNVPSNISSGSNYQLCANGVLAEVCSGGPGTRIVSIPSGGNGGVAGASRINAPKCSATFKDIGGVCFPTTTGLSDAPIYVILSNILSWLMGLFTTLAVGAFVLSGVQYTTAAGSDDQMKTAKNNAKYALIGIIVGLSGFIIVQAVSMALSGSSWLF